jgi:hypothetical protein
MVSGEHLTARLQLLLNTARSSHRVSCHGVGKVAVSRC